MSDSQVFSYLSVEFDGQYSVGVGVVADLRSLLEVTDFELPRGLQAHDGHQAAGEQTLHDTHILRVRYTHTHTHFIEYRTKRITILE